MSALAVEIRPAELADAGLVAANLRDVDRAELEAIGVSDIKQEIRKSIDNSIVAFLAKSGNEPLCIFGVGSASLLGGVGICWLLGCKSMGLHYREFARASLPWRDYFLRLFPVMTNAIDDRNEVTKRWLSWLGATFSEPLAYGPKAKMFRIFELRA